jgi:hypothetical protein
MRLKRSFFQLALIVSGAVAQLASAATLSAPGILVNGDGSQHFRKCSTCPDEPLLDSDEKGGNNVGSAETTGGATNSFSWLAAGTLLGPNALPVLKARAEAQNPSIADPSLGIGTVSAVATARGLQGYHYSGTEAGTYTITFTVNGVLDGDDESIDAGISALSSEFVFSPDGGLQRRVLASARLTKIARLGTGSFADDRSITFSVGANDDFFVSAFLIAAALFVDAHSATGVADASHTMTASFTAGNVSLLTAVPEPSTYGMMLVGLGLLGCAGWRRTS